MSDRAETETYSYLGPSGTFTWAALNQVPDAAGKVWRSVNNVGEALDEFPPAIQESAETSGCHRKQDIVHRCPVVVRDLTDHPEVAADEDEGAVRTDQFVEAGSGPRFCGKDLPHRGPPVADPAH